MIALANMISLDEDALICDLAETYQIYDYKGLKPSLVSTLAVGLRANSRIKMKMTGMKVDVDTTLLASLVDRTSYIIWGLFGGKKNAKPKSILDVLMEKENPTSQQAFDSAESYEQKRKELLDKLKKGG